MNKTTDDKAALKTLLSLVNEKLEFGDDPEQLAPLNVAKRWVLQQLKALTAERSGS